MEAGTGIEPVFTDLQSLNNKGKNNNIGVKGYQDKAGIPSEHDTPVKTSKAPLSKLMKPRHVKAVNVLGYALIMGEQNAWTSTAIIWESLLESVERYELARSVMLSLSPEDVEALCLDVLGGSGYPPPSFLDLVNDAQYWADSANPAELRAYCLMAFMAMSKPYQQDFIDFAKRVVG